MDFNATPANGELAEHQGVIYQYSSVDNTWTSSNLEIPWKVPTNISKAALLLLTAPEGALAKAEGKNYAMMGGVWTEIGLPGLPGVYKVSFESNDSNPSKLVGYKNQKAFTPSRLTNKIGQTFTGWTSGTATVFPNSEFAFADKDQTFTANWIAQTKIRPVRQKLFNSYNALASKNGTTVFSRWDEAGMDHAYLNASCGAGVSESVMIDRLQRDTCTDHLVGVGWSNDYGKGMFTENITALVMDFGSILTLNTMTYQLAQKPFWAPASPNFPKLDVMYWDGVAVAWKKIGFVNDTLQSESLEKRTLATTSPVNAQYVLVRGFYSLGNDFTGIELCNFTN